eukprot:gnl/Chilomastix_caulleri/2389.p1 GENE.gnl/Chilomastix_caulleri/2389~~gnl/Chilomastix_caulleri/2389.p1  ORF type:complete len:117 (+),score=33.74 gnl/Chilomastix_caulleri/2389:26-376(+)
MAKITVNNNTNCDAGEGSEMNIGNQQHADSDFLRNNICLTTEKKASPNFLPDRDVPAFDGLVYDPPIALCLRAAFDVDTRILDTAKLMTPRKKSTASSSLAAASASISLPIPQQGL